MGAGKVQPELIARAGYPTGYPCLGLSRDIPGISRPPKSHPRDGAGGIKGGVPRWPLVAGHICVPAAAWRRRRPAASARALPESSDCANLKANAQLIGAAWHSMGRLGRVTCAYNSHAHALSSHETTATHSPLGSRGLYPWDTPGYGDIPGYPWDIPTPKIPSLG